MLGLSEQEEWVVRYVARAAEMRNLRKTSVEILRRDDFENLSVGGRIILKSILKE
jgi:hypothetical protein